MVNTSDVSTPRCIDTVNWEVFEGSRDLGSVVFAYEGWEPRFQVDADGIHTVVLTMGGIGGTSVAALEIDAEYGLTEEFYQPYTRSCSTAPSTGWWFLGALPLVFIAGRRRR